MSDPRAVRVRNNPPVYVVHLVEDEPQNAYRRRSTGSDVLGVRVAVDRRRPQRGRGAGGRDDRGGGAPR